MAFSFNYLQRAYTSIDPNSGSNPIEGQATGQGPTIWTYNAQTSGANNSKAEIGASAYFLGASGYLEVGDWILATANNGATILVVATVTPGSAITTTVLV